MAKDTRIAEYQNLDVTQQRLLQLCAFAGRALDRLAITQLYDECGWVDSSGKRLTQKAAGDLVSVLLRKGMLNRSSYSGMTIADEFADLAMQEAIRRGQFDKLRKAAAEKKDRYSYYGYSHNPVRDWRDLRIAFYTGQVPEFESILKRVAKYDDVRLLDPFSQDVFASLDPALQQWYFVSKIPFILLTPENQGDILAAFDQWAAARPTPGAETVGLWLDLAVARGDLKSLAELDARTGRRFPEVEGCEALLRGDFERAERCLTAAMPGTGRKGKGTQGPGGGHLPALLYLLLLFKRGTADSVARARALISSASKGGKNPYADAFKPILDAITFRQVPTASGPFVERLRELHDSALATLLVGYVHRWLLPGDEAKSPSKALAKVSRDYRRVGLSWLEAETASLAEQGSPEATADEDAKQTSSHAWLGTASLVNLIKSEPLWQRSLNAIGQLGEEQPARVAAAEVPAASERLIWELNTSYGGFSLQPFAQKRTAKGWSTGRRVGLQRLYDEWNSTTFAFLTDQDRDLCRTMEAHTERGHHGYAETYYGFDSGRAARAIVGHPSVFLPDDRDTPLEIVEQPPRLVVAKRGEHTIRLKLDPPLEDAELAGASAYHVTKDGPRRVILVFYDKHHLKLQRILGTMLDVPAAAAEQVVASIEKVSSLVAVHSEVGGEAVAAERVAGDPRPHLHLLPYQGGLRAEFFVRPCGDDGPFCRLGHGEANVFAKVDGRPMTARRVLAEERRRYESLLTDCPSLAAQTEEDTAYFPSPIEALEALLELEDQVAENRVVLHWPQGQSLRLAGRASGSQLQMSIRRDRDLFAASG
ncbi:MAG: hypothetical protein U1E05_22795, partial [Patescibacteria group bacterium]|nr:hypothetical protein [Patescibacteria group bacterium]